MSASVFERIVDVVTVFAMLRVLSSTGAEIERLRELNKSLENVVNEIVSILGLVEEVAEYAQYFAVKYYRVGDIDVVEEVKDIGSITGAGVVEERVEVRMDGVIEVEPGATS